MAELKTDYVDDELSASMQGKRQFNIVDSEGNILYENVHIEDVSRYSTVGDDFGAEDINSQNEVINQLNNDLNDVAISSQIGSGTKNFSISNTRKRLLCITKKSGVIVESKEIPVNVLESGDILTLGNTVPLITTTRHTLFSNFINFFNSSGSKFTEKDLGITSRGEVSAYTGSSMGTAYAIKGTNLEADLSLADGASITYNGNNSFTISVTDSTLSVYVY